MYGYCVGVIGIDPQYFWDEMSPDEMKAIQESKFEHDKTTWEQARMISYWSVVAMNGTDKIKSPKDLFKFPWEKK